MVHVLLHVPFAPSGPGGWNGLDSFGIQIKTLSRYQATVYALETALKIDHHGDCNNERIAKRAPG